MVNPQRCFNPEKACMDSVVTCFYFSEFQKPLQREKPLQRAWPVFSPPTGQ